MNMSNIRKLCVVGLILDVLVCVTIFNSPAEPSINTGEYDIQKVDDVINYETTKEVEYICKAMTSSYSLDKLRYDKYSKSEDEKERSWEEEAKIRANVTASNYNDYILKKINLYGRIKFLMIFI